MAGWGFSISKTRAINYDENDKSCAEFVIKQVPSAAACIGCGSCTASCSVAVFTLFNIRQMQMLMKRGENKEFQENLHKCMLCGKCQLVCPRGVDTRSMILAMYQSMQINEK